MLAETLRMLCPHDRFLPCFGTLSHKIITFNSIHKILHDVSLTRAELGSPAERAALGGGG